jgi:hypothetical protein
VSDEVWLYYAPDAVESRSIDDVAENLPSKIAPLLEAAMVFLAGDNEVSTSAKVAQDPRILRDAERARLQVFEQSTPPFRTLEECHAWAQALPQLDETVNKEWYRQIDEADRVLARLAWLVRKLESRLTLIRFQLGFGSRIADIYLPPSDPDADWLRHTKELFRTKPLVGDPLGRGISSLPDETAYVNVTDPQAVALSALATELARRAKCWSPGQATAFILTGQPPIVPRIRVWGWVHSLPGGGRRAIIEMYAPPTDRDFRQINRIVRESAGVARKKDFKASDVLLIEFVARTEGTWSQRLNAWNALPGQQQRYKAPSTLINAYKRAKLRRDRQ